MLDQHHSSHLELGSLQKTHRDQGLWILFLVLVLITISLSFLVLLGSLDNIWNLAFLIPMVLLFIIVLVWTLRRDRTSVRISVYEGGLVYQDLHRNNVILWSDIQYIKHRVSACLAPNAPSVEHTYVFQGRDGEPLLTLSFDGTWQWQKRRIAEMIEQATSTILSPSALEAYQQGKDCVFGDITLSLWGVSYSGKMLPWNEVKSLAIDPKGLGTITIRRPGDGLLKWWADVPLEKVDNVEVMRKLLEVPASTHHFKSC